MVTVRRAARLGGLILWMGLAGSGQGQSQAPTAPGQNAPAAPQQEAPVPADGASPAPVSTEQQQVATGNVVAPVVASAPTGKPAGTGRKAPYTGPTEVIVVDPTPMLDEEGRQRLDPDGKPMFNPPVAQLRDKAGHPVFDDKGKPVFQTKTELGYDKNGKKLHADKEPKSRTVAVSIVHGMLTVDGMTAKAQLNYEIADLKYLYFYAPWIGMTVVSNEPFPGATEQKEAFREQTLCGGRRTQFSTDKRQAAARQETGVGVCAGGPRLQHAGQVPDDGVRHAAASAVRLSGLEGRRGQEPGGASAASRQPASGGGAGGLPRGTDEGGKHDRRPGRAALYADRGRASCDCGKFGGGKHGRKPGRCKSGCDFAAAVAECGSRERLFDDTHGRNSGCTMLKA